MSANYPFYIRTYLSTHQVGTVNTMLRCAIEMTGKANNISGPFNDPGFALCTNLGQYSGSALGEHVGHNYYTGER